MVSRFDITETAPVAAPGRFATAAEPGAEPSRFALAEPEQQRASDVDFLEKFVLSDKPIEEWLPSEQANLARSLLDDFENPAEERAKISNAVLLSELFGVPFETVIATQPEMMQQIYGKELQTISDSVVNKKLKEDAVQALKEIPENIWIGTVGMAASTLESMKRRSIQLAGGGILPDEALRHQFEAITPSPEPATGGFQFKPDRLDFIRPQQPLPGAIAAEALGILTRLPDIGAKILRSKQRDLQDEQDIAEISNAPITKLSRLVFQSGVPSMAVAVGVSVLTGNPMVGLVILGETEGGAAFEQQLQAGGSIRKSLIIAELSEAAEIGGEMLVLPKIVKGLTEGISLRKALTLIVENATQEGVTGFNQRFLEVYGTETTKGTDKTTAAKQAFVEAYRAIPENAFVGGATAGLAGIPSTGVSIIKGRRQSKQQARRIADAIAAEVDRTLAEPITEAAVAAEAAKVVPTRPTEVAPEAEEGLEIEKAPAVAKATPVISDPERAKEFGVVKPDILSGIETGKAVSVDVVRGSGRATKEEVFSSGEGESAFGEGRYSAIDRTFAENFGPNIEELTVTLNNPFVLTNDQQLVDLVGRAIPRDGKPRQEFLRDARTAIEGLGHDGIIINISNFADVDASGKSAKRLIEISGATQVVEFKQAPAAVTEGEGIEFAKLPKPLAEGAKKRRREILQDRIKRGESVPQKLLQEFKGEKFADDILTQPAEVKKGVIDVKEEEAIIEPAPSIEVEPEKAGRLVPTGTLDPTTEADALKIVELHGDFIVGKEQGSAVGGIFTTSQDEKGITHITSVEYTSKQVDTAYRTIQEPIPSPITDTELFAMPGKEAELAAIAKKMARLSKLPKAKKGITLPKAKKLPKIKPSTNEDSIKAIFQAASKEATRFAINGVLVEGENLVATDGRRMFVAKGEWGKEGIYLDATALKKGLLGKAEKKGKVRFPEWKQIIPDVSDQKPIVIDDLNVMARHVQQAASMTSVESPGMLIIANQDGSLGFSGAAPEIGHAEINVHPGGKILGAVNPRFLLDMITYHARRGDNTFEFFFPKPDRPILSRSQNGKTSTITMPVNVDPAVPEAVAKAIAEPELVRIISKEAFDAALKRLGDPTKLQAGIDPQQLKDAAIVGGFLIESGVRKFADWSARMIAEIGEHIRPHLQSIWDNLQAGDKIAKQVLRGQIDRARTEESRAALQRRLDILEGKPVKPPISKPTVEEQRVIDAKKFNADIKAHEAQVKGEEGIVEIETEPVDIETEPLGQIMTPEWYAANSKVYKKTILEKGTDLARKTIKGLDFLAGVTSTRLRNISPELGRKLRRHEFNVMTRTTEQTKRIEPFSKATTKRKLGKDFAAFDIAVKNSEGKIVAEFAEKHGFTKELRELRRVLDELYSQGNAVGLEIDYRREYMPRIVKDTKGFLEFFQKGDDWSIIRTVIEDKETARGRALTESERAAAVNTLLRGYRTSALTLTAPGAAKERTVEVITPEINQFYQGFSNSLTSYIQIMNEKIAAREFFGRQSREITNLRAQQSRLRTRLTKLSTRQGRQKPADADNDIRIGFFTGTLTEHISRANDQFEEVTERLDRMGADDLSNTIGQYVLELVVNEEIQPSQEKEVRDLLMGRFDPKSAHGLIGEIIPLTYIDVLSQITNSLTQLEELALAFYRSPVGFIPAATKAVLNLSEITLEDIGVTTVAQELTDADSRKILGALLSITQFKRFDAFAKQTFVNAALKQLQQQAQKEGMTFNDRLERVFGEETDQVVKDLKAGDITEDVKFLAASQLLDIQPIAKSEMPEAYNRAGNLRILYQLKTFMIKQMDFVRTEALQDMRNPVADPTRFMRGFGRLMWLSFSLALFGAGRDLLVDFITGRPFDLSDSVVDTFLRRIFFSRFQYSKATREGIGTAFLEGLVPPTKTIDAITKDIKKVSKNDEDGLDVWRSVPIVGELYFWWFGRGRERALREQAQARREKVRRKPLSTKRKALKTKRGRLKTRRKPL